MKEKADCIDCIEESRLEQQGQEQLYELQQELS